MTDKQRLKEIRERVYELQRATLHGPVPLKTTMQIVADAVELISLVDSKVAGNNLTGEALAEQIINATLCAEPSGACEESAPVHPRDLIRSVAALSAPQYDALCEQHRNEFTTFHVGGCLECWKQSERKSAATLMRSKCIEKVRTFRDASYWSDVNYAALTKLMNDMESVTIQEQKS